MEIHSDDQRLTDLGNEISDAVHKALTSGLGADFVCSVLVGVAADYWMQVYEKPVTALSGILREKAGLAISDKSLVERAQRVFKDPMTATSTDARLLARFLLQEGGWERRT